MVGIGGGVPSEENDIRLGDVIVSQPVDSSGGVVQYDLGKTVEEGRFVRTGSLNRPPNILLSAVSSLQARHMVVDSELAKFLSEMQSRRPKLKAMTTCPSADQDRLFEANYNHRAGEATCARYEGDRLVTRSERSNKIPSIHYGLIASGNQVMKDGVTRDNLRKELNMLCFEMEAAGLMDNFPCLVIRGICDYSDTHKNDLWQPYAAAVAAAYAKELLGIIPGIQTAFTRVEPSATTQSGE
ncbi:hypothetical protein OEA41_008025 [Lepraria neglecta]|uniref:Nucleoside phosphorylase domain-containing protein n=1 Tax=Lepraria neglecta TaxID=209136 RepID=A0AAE0DQT1_9LECA|nr:hypothetical protein OEA41_008025 [Lepraria neglecta]